MENILYGLAAKDNEDMDHGTVVPMYFIMKEYAERAETLPSERRDEMKPKLLRISPTYLESTVLLKMGKIIERAAAHVGRRLVILASADLSHRLKEDGPYGFAEDGPVFDEAITTAMKNFDVPKICELMDDHAFLDRAGQCGTPSVTMMSGALVNDYKVTPELLSYEGPFGVGYAICAYKCEDECVNLARNVLETYIRSHVKITPGRFESESGRKLPDWMKQDRAGVFVCIKKKGDLRGCIGTFLPTTDCVADEICRLAIDSGTEDPRFPAVTENELEDLDYTVDILSSPVSAVFEELDVKRYGVIVTNGYRRGLLLPNLDGVDTVEYQLTIALSKAGISPEEGFDIEKFTVERHT